MRKTKPSDNQAHHTRSRPCFLRDRIDNRCSAGTFKKYVGELHRLEGILASQPSQQPDVYDIMMQKWHQDKLASSSSRRPSSEPVTTPHRGSSFSDTLYEAVLDARDVDQQDKEDAKSGMAKAESFLGTQVEGRYAGRSHSGLAHNSAALNTELQKKLSDAVRGGDRSADKALEKYMSEHYALDHYMDSKAKEEQDTNRLRHPSLVPVAMGDGGEEEEEEEEAKPATKKKSRSERIPNPKVWHKISVRQPLMMKNMTVYRGGKKDQSKTNVDDEGEADSGADLFQALVSVVNLFRGKSRMQIDMLMKDFIKHARIEGATGDGQDVNIGPQGFRNWMHSNQVRDMFLVDRVYKAADVDKSGQVSFIEFRRAVFCLRGTLEQRLEMYVRIFDSSGMGALDHIDVSKLIAMGMPSATPQEVTGYVKVLFEKMDADGSGSLSFGEILDGIVDYPKLRDQLERTVI